jgi:anti-sigma factor RsiW
MSKHLDENKLIDYAWDTLTPQESAVADAHLRDCVDCRAKLTRHQSLVSRVAATIPAMLPDVPARVSAGWPAIVARIPRLRVARTSKRRGAPGFVAVGLAMSTAVLLFVAVAVQAWWFGFGRPPMTVTASYATLHATPIASATNTPERTPTVATPVGFLYSDGWDATLRAMQAPRPQPVVATARP